jgi:hypothetical protein
MLDQVLACFPAHTRALTLVGDPDAALADEGILADCSFRLIAEPDAKRSRWRRRRGGLRYPPAMGRNNGHCLWKRCLAQRDQHRQIVELVGLADEAIDRG